MNPFLELKQGCDILRNTLTEMESEIERLRGEYLVTMKDIQKLQANCNHTDEEGNKTIKKLGHEPGSGKTLGECTTCGTHTYYRYL
jgi:hypothetical protein